MAKTGVKGIKRIINAFFYSVDGFIAVWKNEAAFRQEVWLACFLLPAAFFIAADKIELVLLVSSVFLVVICELINSSIEAAVDRIGDEIHVLSKRAKDIGSSVVMLAFVLMFFVWGAVIFL